MELKYTLCFSLALLAVTPMKGQNKYPDCHLLYFKGTQKKSTSICFDKDGRWGKATAFDLTGKQIYQKEIRRTGGFAGVTFSYYENGAVKTADYNSQPDGGIQWYKIVTYFAPDGLITKEEDQSYDRMNRIYPPPTTYKAPSKPQKNVAVCAVPFATEYWFINDTHFQVLALSKKRDNPKDITVTIVNQQDSIKGGEYITAQQFVDLSNFFQFTAKPIDERTNGLVVKIDSRSPMIYKENIQRWYYHITTK